MSLLYIRSNKSDSLLQTVHLCPAYSNGHPACLFLSPPLALPSHHLPPLCPSLRCQSRRCLNPQVNHCLGNSEFITAAKRGTTLIAMRRYLIDSPFQTLTYREKCLRDRWLGMERTLPLLMTTGRSPSPTTVFDLSSSPPRRMSSPLTPLPSTARTTPSPIHRPHQCMSPRVPTHLARSSGILSSTTKSRSRPSRACKRHMSPPQQGKPSITTISGPHRQCRTAASMKSPLASERIPAGTTSHSSLSTKMVNFTTPTSSKS